LIRLDQNAGACSGGLLLLIREDSRDSRTKKHPGIPKKHPPLPKRGPGAPEHQKNPADGNDGFRNQYGIRAARMHAIFLFIQDQALMTSRGSWHARCKEGFVAKNFATRRGKFPGVQKTKT
jgi:hypothetical protein